MTTSTFAFDGFIAYSAFEKFFAYKFAALTSRSYIMIFIETLNFKLCQQLYVLLCFVRKIGAYSTYLMSDKKYSETLKQDLSNANSRLH